MSRSTDTAIITKKELKLARTRLRDNPHIQEFLGRWVEPGFDNPILGQNILLDLLSDEPVYREGDLTELQIIDLEQTLEHGGTNCLGFLGIFKGNAASDIEIANGQILDRLAEVEAYRWLRINGFDEIHKLPELGKTTVDFAADYRNKSYGIEVTRLGIPQSERKIVRPIAEGEIHINDEVIGIKEFSGDKASPKIQDSISDAIEKKLPQLRNYRANNDGHCTLLVISTGHRFVLSKKLIRLDAGTLPGTWRNSLELVGDALDNKSRALLDAIVLLEGRNESIYPKKFGFLGAIQ